MLNYNTIKKESVENINLKKDVYENFLNSLNEKEIELHSFALIYDDKLVIEKYTEFQNENTLHEMYSITKNLTSISIGILVKQNKIKLDDKIASYFPDKLPNKPHPYILDMSIEDLLTMRTCYNYTTYKRDLTKDWVESFFTSKVDHKNGTEFYYDTSAAHTLCALVERITHKSMLNFLNENLKDYFTFSFNTYIRKDPFGNTMGGTGLMSTTRDLINFALFLEQEGKGVISKSYFKKATSSIVSTENSSSEFIKHGYGYQFWKTIEDGFFCYGKDGQLIIIIPTYKFIAICTSNTNKVQMLFDEIFKYFLYPLSIS